MVVQHNLAIADDGTLTLEGRVIGHVTIRADDHDVYLSRGTIAKGDGSEMLNDTSVLVDVIKLILDKCHSSHHRIIVWSGSNGIVEPQYIPELKMVGFREYENPAIYYFDLK